MLVWALTAARLVFAARHHPVTRRCHCPLLRRDVEVESDEWDGRVLDIRRCSGLHSPTDFEFCGKRCLDVNEFAAAPTAKACPGAPPEKARLGSVRPNDLDGEGYTMRWSLALGFALLFLALALMIVPALSSSAWAQAPNPPAAGAAATSPATIVGFVVVLVALVVLIGVGVKLYDLKRKREGEALYLQAQLSEALLREPGLAGLALTATVHIATFKRSRPIVEIAGQVPTTDARERALNIVRAETARLRPDAQFEDRMAVVPTMAQRAG
jgi:hypothetical protein